MTKRSLIYTRTGDRGTTSLIGGERVSKTDSRLEAYGTIDELNSFIGLLISSMPPGSADARFLYAVQNRLFALGGYLATDSGMGVKSVCTLSPCDVEQIEHRIDELEEELLPLNNFVLPGGCRGASLSHVCRTICRRAERRIYSIEEDNGIHLDSSIKQYINRLSDYFFNLSRFLNKMCGNEEIYWDKNCK